MGIWFFDAGGDDSVLLGVFDDEMLDGTCSADAVDGLQMVVVAVVIQRLGVDILPQARVEQAGLHIVRGQRVPREQRAHIAVCNEAGHGAPGVIVEGDRRTQHPNDIAVVAVVPQHLIKLVVVPGVGGFPGFSGAEGEILHAAAVTLLLKRFVMDKHAVRHILYAPDDDGIAFLNTPRLGGGRPAVFDDDGAVHSGRVDETPRIPYLEVLRIDRGGIEIIRQEAITRRGHGVRLRRGAQMGCVKIRCNIFRQFEQANLPLFRRQSLPYYGIRHSGFQMHV